jgi:hypothetical protein
MDDQNALLDEFVGMVLGTESRPPGSTEFVGIIEAKLDFGIQKYGPGSWKRHDMWGEMLTELVDLFNYPYLAWRVLKEQGVDKSQPQLFHRIEQQLRRISLEAFNNWASMTRLVHTLDALKIPRSLTTEDLVGLQTTLEIATDDRTDADRTTSEGAGDVTGDPEGTDGEAGGSGGPGGDRGPVEVRAGSAGAAASGGRRHEAARLRDRSGAS